MFNLHCSETFADPNLQRYQTNQNLTSRNGQSFPDGLNGPGLDNVSAGDPPHWQTPGALAYNRQYSAPDVNGGGEAPAKPPRMMAAQPRVDTGPNYGSRDFAGETRPDMVDYPRHSVYPYHTQVSASADDPVPAGYGQERLSQLGASGTDLDFASTPVKRSLSGYPPEQSTVTGNPDDLYAKVVKNRNRPTPVQGYADQQVSVYAADAEYPQDPRMSRRKLDVEVTGRDYNFNVQNAGYSRRETGPRSDGDRRHPNSADLRYAPPVSGPSALFRAPEQRLYNRGERHLDGTPMFGDVRKGSGLPANEPNVAIARDNFRGDILLASTPNVTQNRTPSQQQRPRDDDYFQYPSANSAGQVSI
jgi:hypothetical protein